MSENLRIFCYGAAVVIDTALLLAILERRNRQVVFAPVLSLLWGALLFHTGVFAHVHVLETQGGWSSIVRWLAMMTTSAGLLLLPSAMLHAAFRVWRTGLDLPDRGSFRYAFCYAPLPVLLLIAPSLWRDPMGDYLRLAESFIAGYLAYALAAGFVSAGLLLSARRRVTQPESRRFLAYAAFGLIALVILVTLLMAVRSLYPSRESNAVLIASMSPLPLTLLFAYFVIRFNFMQLVLERTIVYGALLIGGLLFHQTVVSDLSERISDAYRLNIGVLETLLLGALVLLYQPLRRRAGEALQYLMGRDVFGHRERVRRLAVEMTGVGEQPPDEMLDWFVMRLGEALITPAAGWLLDEHQRVEQVCGDTRLAPEDAVLLYEELRRRQLVYSRRRDAPSREVLELFKQAGASLAVRLEQHELHGLILLGRRSRSRELSDEEVNAAVLLVEQFGVAMHNASLQRDRMQAERRALQNEKLTTLGLLTSCLTHEIRNPLSSIKTIATLMAEQMDESHPQREDVRLILGEVERLTETTSQFLRFARPAQQAEQAVDLGSVLANIVHVLSHLAKREQVLLEADIEPDLPDFFGDENALREIFFNLLSNSIEAAGGRRRGEGDAPLRSRGRVLLTCRSEKRRLLTTISDNGGGVSPEVRDRIFEPFVTTKQTGGGLGLYIVSRRVRELGGEIDCSSAADEGARFSVALPLRETSRRLAAPCSPDSEPLSQDPPPNSGG